MISKLGASARHLLGRDAAGRNLPTFPDDTFIVSYPKSGNTWTRFLVASLVHNQLPMTFLKADQVIPSIDSQPRKDCKTLPRPRVGYETTSSPQRQPSERNFLEAVLAPSQPAR